MTVISRRAALAAFAGSVVAGCSRVQLLAANVPAAFGPYHRIVDVRYGSAPQHALDIYLPEPPSAAAVAPATSATSAIGRPLVLFWHGGRWEYGDKSQYRFAGAALASLGVVAVLPNYRHYPQVKMAGFMEDAAHAVHWAMTHCGEFGADPKQIFLMGHSAGAHLAALVTLDTRYLAPRVQVAGLIGLSGPYDFLPLEERDLQDMFGPPELYAQSQPIHFVRSDAPRTLLVHGLRDTTVRPRNSSNLAAALTTLGVPVTLRLYPELQHGDTLAALSVLARSRAPVLREVANFIGQPARA